MVVAERTFAGVRVQTLQDVKNLGLFILLYGPGGSGKTRTAGLLARSPHGQDVLHVDVEGGATALADLIEEGRLDSLGAKSWRDVQAIHREFAKGEHKYNTIIWDNLTEIQMLSLKAITTGKPEIQHWGESTANMLTFLREARDVSRFQQKNVVLICWDETEKDELDGMIKKRVQFTPSLAAKVPGIVTMVGHLQVLPGGLRHLSFSPSIKNDSKFRVSPKENAAQIPLDLYFGPDGNPLADMLSTIREGAEFPFKKYAKPAPGR